MTEKGKETTRYCVTLQGLPLTIVLEWPFKASVAGADFYVLHGDIRLEDGRGLHALVALQMTRTVREVLTSLEAEQTESPAVNTLRKAVDNKELEFLRSPKRLPVPLSSRAYDFKRNRWAFAEASAEAAREFLLRKVYWETIGRGRPDGPVWLADPLVAENLPDGEPDELNDDTRPRKLRPGDSLLVDTKAGYAFERIPKAEVEDLVLEEVPDVSYLDIGGLTRQIEQIRDAVELPFLHKELYREYALRPPKGVLLYGPPGCGKTLIAKAVANSLAKKMAEVRGDDAREAKSYFLNIKGPELLNKFVGETERHIRLIFQRAREKASEGTPVIVFFDEMDSIFRTRGTGVSSDVETTVVPQLLSEIDGVEGLENVIVIGASNREDMIDPAILRPGRLDVKIKIERPDAEAAQDIFSKYLVESLPVHADDLAEFDGDRSACIKAMIEKVVDRMYAEIDDNRFLEVTYANGDKEVMYFKDFNSGAMIQNVVDRAKKNAIKSVLETGQPGLRIQHLLDSIVDEFAENEDLPNTTNPDDWARISGKKGERIVYIRTLVTGKSSSASRAIDTESNLGQYL